MEVQQWFLNPSQIHSGVTGLIFYSVYYTQVNGTWLRHYFAPLCLFSLLLVYSLPNISQIVHIIYV